MSRSYRHTPICGNACATSDRHWKRIWHRGYRHRVRQQVRQHQEPVPIRAYPGANVWCSNKDGKHWFGHRLKPRYRSYWIHRLGSVEAYEGWWDGLTRKMLRK